jgi:hypothetical protein
MANTLIQIKSSLVTATPTTLNVAEPAYSYVSNTLFIGTPNSDGVIPIGGKFYLDQQQLIFNTANAAFTSANNAAGSSTDQTARNTANAAFTAANNASDLWVRNQANSAFIQANASYAFANTLETVNTTQNNSITAAFLQANAAFLAANNATDTFVRNHANAAFLAANTADSKATSAGDYANGAFTAANTKFASSGGSISGDVNITGNLIVTGNVTYTNTINQLIGDNIITLNADLPQNATPTENAGIEIERGVLPNAQFIWVESAGKWSANNGNTSFYIGAESAGDYANAAFAQANAAFNSANNSATTGNTINLGANTVGQLVSNAVTLTTTTKVTDGLALLNNVLGKLVPASPTPFPGGTALTINSLSTYRMTDFVQTDRTTTGGKSVAGGSTVTSVRRASSYTTNTYNNLGPGDSGTLTLYKNNVATGAVTFTSASANGTYSDLIITDSKDYAQITGAASGFWRSFDAQGSGSTSNGWNEIYISHSGASNTSTPSWYYDDSAPGTPTFTSASISPLSESLTYSSTIPHYNSSTTFKLGVNVAKLSGDMFPTSNTFFTGTAGGAFAAPASNTYPTVGITYPLARNLYVSSGSVTVNTTASITTGFSSSATGPSVTVDNSYATGSQAFTTALANTVLYKTGTSSLMEESAVTFGSTVGTGSGTAGRILNPGSTDNPAYANNATLFNSQTGTLQTYDATIVAATLKHDQTNYASGYLPVGPNLSSGRTGAQYFTFKFVRTSLSKFNIKFTGTIAGLWVALPGTVIDSTSSLNGWLDMSSAYGGSGIPGANAPGNGSNGCALGGVVTLNSAVTAHSKTCTFGTISSSNSTLSEIYVRIKLTSGQTVTALSLETASN